MNLQELIDNCNDPALVEKLLALVPDGHTDLTTLKVNVKYRLEKFEGEYSPEAMPFEVIEGGDGLATKVFNPSDED